MALGLSCIWVTSWASLLCGAGFCKHIPGSWWEGPSVFLNHMIILQSHHSCCDLTCNYSLAWARFPARAKRMSQGGVWGRQCEGRGRSLPPFIKVLLTLILNSEPYLNLEFPKQWMYTLALNAELRSLLCSAFYAFSSHLCYVEIQQVPLFPA